MPKHSMNSAAGAGLALIATIAALSVPAESNGSHSCPDPCATDGPANKPNPGDNLLPKSRVRVEQEVNGGKLPLNQRLVSDPPGTLFPGTIKVTMKPRAAAIPQKKYPHGRIVEVVATDRCATNESQLTRKYRFRRGKTAIFTYDIACRTFNEAAAGFTIFVKEKSKKGYKPAVRYRFLALTKAVVVPVPAPMN